MADNVVRLYDNFKNFLAGFGVLGRDKAESQYWWLEPLDVQQLEAAYRGDWLARKIIEIPASDSTRAWREWSAEKDQVKAIEGVERQHFIQRKMMTALIKARLYGGAAMIIGTDDGPFNEELNIEGVKKDGLKFVHVVDRWMLAAGPLNRDITSPWFGEPTYYTRVGVVTPPPIGGVTPPETISIKGQTGEDQIYIHPSRVVRFLGAEYPSLDRVPDQWGDPVLQYIQSTIKNAAMVSASLGQMIAEAKLDVIKIEGLSEVMGTAAGAAKYHARFSNANAAKSAVNALLLDKSEEWERKELRVGGVDKVMQMFLLLCCGAADIPATRLFGREPAGQNSTGESDIRNYYDRLHSDQIVRLKPAMHLLDEVIIRSALGSKPDEIDYDWNSLWQLSDTEKADVNLKLAQAHLVDVNAGVIAPQVLKQGRENYLVEDGFMYPGIDSAIEEFDKENESWGENVHETGDGRV